MCQDDGARDRHIERPHEPPHRYHECGVRHISHRVRNPPLLVPQHHRRWHRPVYISDGHSGRGKVARDHLQMHSVMTGGIGGVSTSINTYTQHEQTAAVRVCMVRQRRCAAVAWSRRIIRISWCRLALNAEVMLSHKQATHMVNTWPRGTALATLVL